MIKVHRIVSELVGGKSMIRQAKTGSDRLRRVARGERVLTSFVVVTEGVWHHGRRYTDRQTGSETERC